MSAAPKYITKLLEAYAAGQVQRGAVGIAEVRHDDWCAIWQGNACNCEPDIEVRYRWVS